MSDSNVQKALAEAKKTGDLGDWSKYHHLLCRRDGHMFTVITDVPKTTDMVLQCETCADWFPARFIIYIGGTYQHGRWYQIIDTVKGEVTHTFGDASAVLRMALKLNNEAQFGDV